MSAETVFVVALVALPVAVLAAGYAYVWAYCRFIK